MKFIISGRNFEVSDVLKERLIKKVGKLAKFFNPDTEVHTTFSMEKNNHVVEVTIPFNGVVFRAEEKNDDMFTSIDKIVDVLERQVRKNKTRFEKKIKSAPAKDSIVSELKDSDTDDKRFKIVQSKKYSVKPMTLEEALMQLNLEDDDFLVFSNASTKQVNLVYRLDGGGFGLVEPE